MTPDAEAYLLGLFDFEKAKALRHKNKPFTLDRMHAALELLEHPDRSQKIVHVAGTKGKGSTVEYLYRMLRPMTEGKIGLFTSPHLVHVSERIRVDDNPICDADLLRLSKKVREINQRHFNDEITFFETLVLIALIHFEEQECEWTLLETGLGGRLDATNATRAHTSVITRIGLDHQEVLGESIEEIAAEKAGIIKSAPVLCLHQTENVNEVFRNRSSEMDAELDWIRVPAAPADIPASKWENLHIAANVASHLYPPCASDELVRSHSTEEISGRLQWISYRDQNILIDAAHNVISLQALSEYLEKLNKPVDLCFAMASTRDPETILGEILPQVERVLFLPLPSRPGIEPGTLAQIAKKNHPQLMIDTKPTLEEWMNTPHEGVKLVTGSFYLLGEVLKILSRDDAG